MALDRYYPNHNAFLKSCPDRSSLVVCFTNGCFDLLHPGHVRYLEEVRALGGFLIVGLNSDASVTRLKGRGRPIQNEVARATVLCGLRSVDAVIRFDDDTPLSLIAAIKPDILAKGADYTYEAVVGKDVVEKNGGKVVLVPFTVGYGTSDIVARIKGSIGCLDS